VVLRHHSYALIMNKIFFRFLKSIFSFILALWVVYPAFAHGSEPRLEISVMGAHPGGVVDVRGVDFDYEEIVKLYLSNTYLGEVVPDVEGIFLQTFVLPVDLPEGLYRIRAVTQHHEVLSPEFSVQGTAILGEGGGQGARDEDDPLLAPMPTFAPGVVPGGNPQSSAQPTPQTTALETPTSQENLTTLIYSILLGIGIIALVGIRILKKR
jgi:hypothetical protein